MHTAHANPNAAPSRLARILFALPIVVALLSMGIAHAAGAAGRVEPLPRVVVTGKSLAAQALERAPAQLPRVVVHGQSIGYATAVACAEGQKAASGRLATQVC
jgi:hypothetical protein